MLFLSFFPALAQARESFEIRPKQGLILLEEFQQWVGTEYQYAGSESGGAGAASHTFQERYNFSAKGAIIDPSLLRLQLAGAFWAEQINASSTARGSSSSDSLEYQYSLAGTAFERGWHPVSFTTSRTLSTVVSPYIPAYNADNKSTGIECSFLKGPVQTAFGYLRDSMDSSGGGVNTSASSNQFHLSAQHSYRDISNSGLNANWSSQTSTGGKSEHYMINFHNGTALDRNKKYRLESALTWQDAKLVSVPQSNLDISELLQARLGSALEASLAYAYRNNITTDLAGHDQLSQANSVTASLSHRLFNNFATRLSGHYRVSDLLGGTEEAYGGIAAVKYTRRLQAAARLTLDLSGTREVTDRKLKSSDLSVPNEQQTAPPQGESITLGTSGVLVAVNSVRNSSTGFTYTEGTDYTVDLLLRRITITPGGSIAPGTLLLVSYILRLDPSVKYATNSFSAASALTFLDHYIVSAFFMTQQQGFISGQPVVDLTNVRTESLRFQGVFPENTYTLAYTEYFSNISKYRDVEGGWQYIRRFTFSSLSLQLRDSYAVYDAIGAASGYTQNNFNATSTYRCTLLGGAQLLLSASYADTSSGRGVSSDFFYVNGSLQAQINKLAIDLGGQVAWRLYGKQSSRNDYVHFGLTRYF
ncbi:MAG TPA: hypothetical protein VI298_03085 [Geobacteraceae bacterium]